MKRLATALLALSALGLATGASAQMEGSGQGNPTAQTQQPRSGDPAAAPRSSAPTNATGTSGQGNTSTAPADMTPPRPTGETPPQGRPPEQSGSVPGQPGATPD